MADLDLEKCRRPSGQKNKEKHKAWSPKLRDPAQTKLSFAQTIRVAQNVTVEQPTGVELQFAAEQNVVVDDHATVERQVVAARQKGMMSHRKWNCGRMASRDGNRQKAEVVGLELEEGAQESAGKEEGYDLTTTKEHLVVAERLLSRVNVAAE